MLCYHLQCSVFNLPKFYLLYFLYFFHKYKYIQVILEVYTLWDLKTLLSTVSYIQWDLNIQGHAVRCLRLGAYSWPRWIWFEVSLSNPNCGLRAPIFKQELTKRKQTLKNIMLHSSSPKFKGIYRFIGRNRSLKLKKWQTRARPRLPLLQQVILPQYSTNRSQIKTKMDEWRQEKLTKSIYQRFTVRTDIFEAFRRAKTIFACSSHARENA